MALTRSWIFKSCFSRSQALFRTFHESPATCIRHFGQSNNFLKVSQTRPYQVIGCRFLANPNSVFESQKRGIQTSSDNSGLKNLVNRAYLDVLFQPKRFYHESEELDRKSIPKSIKYQIPRPKFAQNWKHMKRHQMKKHQRTVWRKKWAAFIRQTKLRRNIKKERAFRAEILGRVQEAEKFDAKKYVEDMFSVVDNAPKGDQKTDETLIKVFKLIRQYRSETSLVSPIFDDPVPRKKYEKMFKSK